MQFRHLNKGSDINVQNQHKQTGEILLFDLKGIIQLYSSFNRLSQDMNLYISFPLV